MSANEMDSTEAWLERNLHQHAATRSEMLLKTPTTSFRTHSLAAVLAIAALVVAAMWYQEEHLGLISAIDRLGYPVMFAATTLGALLLLLRPRSLHGVMVMVFVAYVIHLLAVYYTEMASRLLTGTGSDYEFTILALWLPLGYVGSFVFFSPRLAIRASLGIYAAIALPQAALFGFETDAVTRQIAVAILISQPVYIAALWGVGLLKTHAHGIHEVAHSLRIAATVDALTGVANRRAITHALETVTRVATDTQRPVALLLLDVDHFKKINDTHGHDIGDEVLIALAQRTLTQLRNNDLLGRWGGEEFIILALDLTEPQALQIAERLRVDLEQAHYARAGRVTVSIGVTRYVPGESINLFIKRADDALYLAKERGRNRIEGMFSQTATAV